MDLHGKSIFMNIIFFLRSLIKDSGFEDNLKKNIRKT